MFVLFPYIDQLHTARSIIVGQQLRQVCRADVADGAPAHRSAAVTSIITGMV